MSFVARLRSQPLYPILDPAACSRAKVAPLDLVAAWLKRGLSVFQLRVKDAPSDEYLSLARRIQAAFPETGIIANDFAGLALEHTDLFAGLHLGQEDWEELGVVERDRVIAMTRPAEPEASGSAWISGFSTHGPEQLRRALKGPRGKEERPLWTYLAIGPLATTDSKVSGLSPVLDPNERLACFQEYRAFLKEAGPVSNPDLLLVGIGGVEASNVAELFGRSEFQSAPPVLPAVIGAATNVQGLDQLLKEVALLSAQNSLET